MQSASMLDKTAVLVAAYFSRNRVPAAHVADVIVGFHAALSALQTEAAPGPAPVGATPVEIATSIRYDRLVSFIDGKAYKSLKRHLTAHGMTPSEYRSRYGLPQDYPMVSPGYAKVRSRIARQTHRGREVA